MGRSGAAVGEADQLFGRVAAVVVRSQAEAVMSFNEKMRLLLCCREMMLEHKGCYAHP
jgi:hypothetical protein